MTEQRHFSRRDFLVGGAAAGAGLLAASAIRSVPRASAQIPDMARASNLTSASGPLNVTYFSGQSPASALTSIFDGFTKATGIQVNFLAEPAVYANTVTKFTTALSAGSTDYDLLFIDDIMNATFSAAGWLLPLEDVLSKSILGSVTAPHIALSSLRGHLYRMPIDTGFYVMFYRKDLLKAADVAVPTTWAEVLSASRTLTKAGKYGLGMVGSMWDDFVYWLPQAGGSFVNYDLPGSQQALEFMHELVTVYKVVPPSYITDSFTTVPTYLESGDVAMWFCWNGFLGGFVADKKFYGSGALGVAAPAKGPVSNVTDFSDWGYAIPKFSPRQQQAAKFIDYVSSAASEKTLALTQELPARDDAFKASLGVIAGGNNYADLIGKLNLVPRPMSPVTTLLSEELPPILADYVAGRTSLSTAVKSAQAVLKKYPSS